MANLSNINGKFVVEQTTGYVGVGTTDPNYPIEVLNASAEIALNASGGSIYRIQSDSASNFIIRKAGVGDRLVINSAGNATFAGSVGIGAAPLQGKLDILNNGDYDAHTGHGLTINSSASNAFTSMYMGADDSVDAAYIQSAGRNTSFTTKKLLLQPNGGNVGIGTTNPAQNFVVADATNGNGIELVPAGTGTIQAYNRGTSLYNTLNIDSLSNRIRSVNETVFNNGSGFSESMRILSGGNVGIGETAPQAKLNVKGISGTPAAPTAGVSAGILRIESSNAGVGLDIGQQPLAPYSMWMQVGNTSNSTGDTYPLLLNPIGGNVGIGTDSPTFQLSIENHATTTSTAIMELDGKRTNGTDGPVGEMIFSNNGDTFATVAGVRDGADNSGSIVFQTQDSGTFGTRMTISSDGNVGIGVSNPETSRLLVRGSTNDSTSQIFQAANLGGATKYAIRADGDNKWYKSDNSLSMVLTSTGSVGIGTTSPNYPLDIQSTATGLTSNLKLNKGSATGDYAEIAFQLWNGAGSGLNTFGGSGTSRPSVVLRAINENANSAAGAFVVGTFTGGATNSTLTEKFRISSAGNVGIGTTSPVTKLAVQGATQFGGNSTSGRPLTAEYSAYGTTQNLYTITLTEGNVWSPGIAVINFAASRSGLQKYYAGQIIVRLVYYSGSSVAGQGGWSAPSNVGAVVAYSGQAETYMRVYVNGTNTGNPMTIQIGVRDIDDTTNYFVSDIRVTLRRGVNSITS